MLTLLLICVGCAGIVYALASLAFGGRSDVSRRVAELEDTATPHTHQRTNALVAHLLSGADKTAIAAKLAEAGWYRTTVTTFMVSRVVGLAVAGGLAAFVVFELKAFAPVFVLFAIGVAAAGFILPSFALDDAIRKRKLAIGNRIPDFLDLISTTVEAGIALNAALAIAVNALDGPLAEELGMVLSDVRLGRNRADAFNAMAKRAHQVDLSSMVMAIVQTERLGGNIGHVLDELASEARARRLQRAEEIAATLPVKMALPMALFMLPALFVMIFTPVIAQLIGGNR